MRTPVRRQSRPVGLPPIPSAQAHVLCSIEDALVASTEALVLSLSAAEHAHSINMLPGVVNELRMGAAEQTQRLATIDAIMHRTKTVRRA